MAATANSIITPQTINVPAANVLLSTAMTSTKAYDGTEAVGTAMGLLFTAGANGSQLPKVRIKIASTNGATPSGTTAATVVRIWFNNGSANTTATNNVFYDEVAIPATAITAVASTTQYTLDFGNLVLPAGWKVYAGLATAVGNTNGALAVSMPGGGDL